VPLFAGVDLTCSAKKASAYALLTEHLRVVRLESLCSDLDIIAAIERDRPVLTAIDAPLSLPLHLHCLDAGCPCCDPPTPKGRQCERELARRNIGCYFTTKKSIIVGMVRRGLDLRKELTSRGFPVIEAYPYAAKRVLWGRTIPKKTTMEGREFLRSQLSPLVSGLGNETLSHDSYDAVLAAYTAYLHQCGATELVGDSGEGQIAIPRDPLLHI
jgi:predicted nuclease with RNAse H fold